MNLYILTKKNKNLLNLHLNLKEKVSIRYSEEYTPHVSLLYGNLPEKKQKELQKTLSEHYPKKIHCQRIDIYNCTGKENRWYLEESFNLK